MYSRVVFLGRRSNQINAHSIFRSKQLRLCYIVSTSNLLEKSFLTFPCRSLLSTLDMVARCDFSEKKGRDRHLKGCNDFFSGNPLVFFISQGGEPKIEKCPFDRYNIRGAKDDANRDKRYNKLTQIIVSCEHWVA